MKREPFDSSVAGLVLTLLLSSSIAVAAVEDAKTPYIGYSMYSLTLGNPSTLGTAPPGQSLHIFANVKDVAIRLASVSDGPIFLRNNAVVGELGVGYFVLDAVEVGLLWGGESFSVDDRDSSVGTAGLYVNHYQNLASTIDLESTFTWRSYSISSTNGDYDVETGSIDETKREESQSGLRFGTTAIVRLNDVIDIGAGLTLAWYFEPSATGFKTKGTTFSIPVTLRLKF